LETDGKKKGIFLLSLMADDGSVDHVVAIVENKIFDPNGVYALELSKENLDFICGEGNQFVGIREGRHYFTHFHHRKGLV